MTCDTSDYSDFSLMFCIQFKTYLINVYVMKVKTETKSNKKAIMSNR